MHHAQEGSIDMQKAAGFCQHGNVPTECEQCKQRLDELFSLLMSPDEEYEETIKRTENEVKRVSRQGREILVHGTAHKFSMEPIADMVKLFETESPDLLIVEGTAKVDIDPQLSGDEILAKHGEQQYFRWLAKQKNIEVKSWDVPWIDRFRDAAKKHSRDAIVGWAVSYATKLLFEKKNGQQPTEAEVRAAITLAFDKDTVSTLRKEFPDLEFDPEKLDLDAIIKKYNNGKGIDALRQDTAEDLGTPWHQGETNDVIRDMILLRDRNAIKVIDEAGNSHQKVFVIAGNDHVITWERALQKMDKEGK